MFVWDGTAPSWTARWIEAQPWFEDARTVDTMLREQVIGVRFQEEFANMMISKHNVHVFVYINEVMYIKIPVNAETTMFILKTQ